MQLYVGNNVNEINFPSEEEKNIYILGIVIAKELSGKFKGILNKDEIKIMSQGLKDSLLGEVESEDYIVHQYEETLADFLQSRVGNLICVEKMKGDNYRAEYLISNPGSKQTPSGLIYHEIVTGNGLSVSFYQHFINVLISRYSANLRLNGGITL